MQSFIENINKRIKAIRKTMDMTQAAFAKPLGITQGHLTDIERGKKRPSDTLLIAVIYCYAVNPLYLYENRGEMFIGHGEVTDIGSPEQKEVWEQIDHIFTEGSQDDIDMLMGAVQRVFIRIKRTKKGQGDKGEDNKSGRFPGEQTEPPGELQKPA